MIVDCHCHAGMGDKLSGPWDTRAPLGRYLGRCRQAGIERSVVFATLGIDHSARNDDVARWVARLPERLIGFVYLDAAMGADLIEAQLKRYVGHLGFRGIKVHRADRPISRAICEAARRYRIPVLYDVFDEIAPIELLAHEYPDVNFIIPHLGSYADRWSSQLALIDHLQRHPNVYADTSGVRNFDLLEQAVQRAGPGKLLFGSDGPWLHPAVELEKLRHLRLPLSSFYDVAGRNLLRLLSQRKLPQPRPARALSVWVEGLALSG